MVSPNSNGSVLAARGIRLPIRTVAEATHLRTRTRGLLQRGKGIITPKEQRGNIHDVAYRAVVTLVALELSTIPTIEDANPDIRAPLHQEIHGNALGTQIQSKARKQQRIQDVTLR